MNLLKNYILFIFLFQCTLYSQITITTNNLKVDNNLVSDNTIAFNDKTSLNISLDIKMETTDGSINTTLGNLFLYYKKDTDDIPTQVAFQSITFTNNYPKTNYVSNTFFSSITLFKNNFLSNGGTFYAEYKTNNQKTYKSQAINIAGGGHTAMPMQPNTEGKQILGNAIGNDQIIVSGEIPKPFYYDIPYYRNSDNLPGRHGSSSSSTNYTYLTIFKWQIKTQSSDWTDIPGETSPGYFPNKAIYENTSYRRVAFYEGGHYIISNTIFIIINNPLLQNTICCSQTLTSSDNQPKEIVGNTPNLNNFIYNWQTCEQPNYINQQVWSDLVFGTDQNLRPGCPATYYGRGTETKAYRRLIKQNGIVISISNQVNITCPTPSTDTGPTRRDGTTGLQSAQSLQILEEPNENNTFIYPNPFSNNFSIEGPVNYDYVKLYDSSGKLMNIEKTKSSENKIDIKTNEKPGVYILKIDNSTYSKTLFKN